MTTVDRFERIRAMGCVIDPIDTRQLYADAAYLKAPVAVQVSNLPCTDVAYGEHPRQRLDVYLPQGSGGARPVVLFLHGGGFIRGDKSERSHVGHLLAHHGFVAVLANYRLAPECQWPSGAQDVASALDWVHQAIAAYGGDPSWVFVIGESAGAAHAAAATLMQRFARPGGPRFAGVALMSGVYNPMLEYLARQQFGIPTPDARNDAYFGPPTALLSGPDAGHYAGQYVGQHAGQYADQCVVHLADAKPFPLLITYAELDPTQMQVQAGELFARLVTQLGFSPALQVILAHNHLSQVWSLGTDDERLSSVLLDFLNRHSSV